MNTKKEIDYYGNSDNYIHLKFGDCRKSYNFTSDFISKYPTFATEFEKYFNFDEKRQFKNVFNVVTYIFNNKIPVHFYYNYTDMPAKNKKEVMEYLLNENNFTKLY